VASTFSITSNVTLYAVWTANSLTVTTDEQGGSAIANATTTTGASMASPGTPTRSGYTFAGWFVASSGGSAISFPYTHGQTANFTLFAQWTADTQTITYAAGTGGTGSAPSSPTTVSYGSTFTTPANTYTRSGFNFMGWNDGTATYAVGASYPSTGTVSGNVTLTATWAATCANSGVCAVGDIGPGGGKVFYVHPEGGTFTSTGSDCNTACRYLEAAPDPGTEVTRSWATNCCSYRTTSVPGGVTATAIGSGMANSIAISNQGNSSAQSAAVYALEYSSGATTDWHLPSKDELYEFSFRRTVIAAGIENGNYWSSSELDSSQAWRQDLTKTPGNQSTTSKEWIYRVRPVRAFG